MDETTSKVQVAVRVRPLLPSEITERSTSCLEVSSEQSNVLVVGGNKQFTFDYVFPPESSQQKVYEKSVQPLVASIFEGYNATCFAFGQTGSGKTFTMGSGCLTNSSSSGSSSAASGSQHLEDEPTEGSTMTRNSLANIAAADTDLGIIPRAVRQIFDTIAEKKALSASANNQYYLRVQFLELYAEQIRDLLDPVGTAQGKKITLREVENNNAPQVVGAVEESVKSASELLSLLERGTLVRTTGSTQMNTHSSRSHAIFSIILEQHLKVEPLSPPEDEGDRDGISGSLAGDQQGDITSDDTEFRMSKFHFVDLAGSERAKRTGATGLRMFEGIHINKGLLALGNVISALGTEDPSSGKKFVNYRDSKLTRLLQDSLGGNSRTLMITCVSPADINFEETLNALRYASRARYIKNHAVINRDPSSSLIANLKAEVARLKYQLSTLSSASGEGITTISPGSENTATSLSPRMVISPAARNTSDSPISKALESEVARLAFELDREIKLRRNLESKVKLLEAERRILLGSSVVPSQQQQHRRREYDDDFDVFAQDEEEVEETAAVPDDENDDALVEEASQQTAEESDNDEASIALKLRFEQAQRALRRLVSKYDETLQSKEEMMLQISQERLKFETFKAHFEQKMTEMTVEVKLVTEQRLQLVRKLLELEKVSSNNIVVAPNGNGSVNNDAAASKLRLQVAEQDNKLRELEDRGNKLREARLKLLEWQKKETQTRGEIDQMKREKSDLQRRMQDNHKRYLQELRERQLEIAGLQRERVRLEQDSTVFQAKMERDSKMIQIKSEQVAAMQRKLREAQRYMGVKSVSSSSSNRASSLISEREQRQREEIERLASLQVQREEELIGLRKALAKKEIAILRRNKLVEKLKRLKGEAEQKAALVVQQQQMSSSNAEEGKFSSSPSSSAKLTLVVDFVPTNATDEDVHELEQRLEALDSEIMFRDRQCRQVLQGDDEPSAALSSSDKQNPHQKDRQNNGDGQLLQQGSALVGFETPDQAKEVCRILMEMFVESKRELRELKSELSRANEKIELGAQRAVIDRRRAEALFSSATFEDNMTIGPVEYCSNDDELTESFSSLLIMTKTANDEESERPDDRIRKLEARLKSLEVVDEVVAPLSAAAGRSTTPAVFDRLTSRAAYTGIHKYGAVVSPPPSSQNQSDSVSSSGKKRRPSKVKSPAPIAFITSALESPSLSVQEPGESSILSYATEARDPKSPTPPGWERVAAQSTQSWSNKRYIGSSKKSLLPQQQQQQQDRLKTTTTTPSKRKHQHHQPVKQTAVTPISNDGIISAAVEPDYSNPGKQAAVAPVHERLSDPRFFTGTHKHKFSSVLQASSSSSQTNAAPQGRVTDE